MQAFFSRPLFWICTAPVWLGVIAWLLNFNGLYGQDSFEYLRQSKVIFDRFHGIAPPPLTQGDINFPGGYPLLAAVLRFVLIRPELALVATNWLFSALSLGLFYLNLGQILPGSNRQHRLAYTVLLLLTPVFLTASMVSMSDITALGCILVMLYGLLHGAPDKSVIIFTALSGIYAIQIRYAMIGIVAPAAVLLAWQLTHRKQWSLAGIGILVVLFAILPYFWLKQGQELLPAGHSLIADSSLVNIFRNQYDTPDGHLHFWLPNGLYIWQFLVHPAFCLTLMLLFALVKKTDVMLSSRKYLIGILGIYLLVLAITPMQNLRFLLPAYVIALLLLFPAFDRLMAYGLSFFSKYTRILLVLAVLVQVACCIRNFKPLVLRNSMEREMATVVKHQTVPNATIYAFDWDLALQAYVPDRQYRNLWMQVYEQVEPGGFLLFNAPALEKQWSGRNPMLNWEKIQQTHTLTPVHQFENGWTLYQINN